MNTVWLLIINWSYSEGEYFIYGAYPTKEIAESYIPMATAQAIGHKGWELKPIPYVETPRDRAGGEKA